MTIGARTRESIGKPPAPLPARVGAISSVLSQDGQDGRTDEQNVSLDTSLKTLIDELLETIQRGESVSGQKRESVSGHVYVFRVQPAGSLSPDERFRLCVEWMRREQVTNRKAFQSQCPDATESAALHHRCIKALKREGLIERIGREYVFKEQ